MTSGLGVAILLGLLSMVGALSINFGFYHIQTFGLLVRTSVFAQVFKKSLKISPAVRGNFTTGEIVTLMSVDAERLWFASIFGNWLWMGPVQIVGSIALLYLQVNGLLVLPQTTNPTPVLAFSLPP